MLRYVLRDATHTPSDHIQISQVGASLIERETNTSEMETRLSREEVRTDRIHTHSKGIQVPSSNSELSSHDMNMIEGPLVRPCIPDTMPQLDRPLSIHTRRKRPVPQMRRYTTMPGGSYPDDSDSDSHDNRSHEERRYPGRRYFQDKSGRPPNRGRPPNDGGPPDDGGPPGDGGSPDDGGPPGKWKTVEMTWKTRTARPTRTSWTHMSYNSTATPGHFRYNCIRKYIGNSWPVNVAIG